MKKKYTLYVVPHTHWDREWYGSFQLFRVRLVRLMNKLLDLLDRDPDYKTFNLDGQTILLEDYLEVHPEKRDVLKRYISEKRLLVGPWYILPDEFLTSGEALVRNLLLGKTIAEDFGHRLQVGYIPDTFGHIAQLPQILRGFGLENTMHFRGLDVAEHKSELWWEAPDGSRVLLHHLSPIIGYSDSAVLAENPTRAAYDLQALAHYKAERATTSVLLSLQGVDHTEANENLSTILKVAEDTINDVEMIHASLEDFWSALTLAVDGLDLATIYGEIRDVPRTKNSINFLLYNVLSSRIDNKIHNAQTLTSLERWSEPWSAQSWFWGVADYPHGHLWTAWRWLLKNHPHDSIGGCSVDEVHRQMTTRFEWAQEIADYLTEERFRLIAEDIDFSDLTDDELPLVLFNATAWERDEVVTVDIDIPLHWLAKRAKANYHEPAELTLNSTYAELMPQRTREEWLYGLPELHDVSFRGLWIRPVGGEPIPLEIISLTDTPIALALASGPRGTMDVKRVRAQFRAKLPAYGYTSFAVSTDKNPVKWQAPEITPNQMQNAHLKVSVNPNGTFDLTDLQSNQIFTGLGLFEDGGDNGDGYMYSPPPFDGVLTTQGASPRITHIGRGVGAQHIEIHYNLYLPAGLNDKRDRRQEETIICPLTVNLTLRDGSPRLDIEIKLDNRAKDHRLRMLFPTDLSNVDQAHSAMQFDVMTRPITPKPIHPNDWWVEDPPSTFPMHGWMDIHNEHGRGLCIIAEGVHEFSVKPTQRREVALTLLRAVGYLGARRDLTTIIGGAGPSFPTPEAQLQQSITYRLALYSHNQSWQKDEVWRQATNFLTPPRAITADKHTGTHPAQASGISITGQNAILSAIKQAENRESLIVRLYNPTMTETTATITLPVQPLSAEYATLQEESLGSIFINDDHGITVTIPPKKIISVRIQTKMD